MPRVRIRVIAQNRTWVHLLRSAWMLVGRKSCTGAWGSGAGVEAGSLNAERAFMMRRPFVDGPRGSQ